MTSVAPICLNKRILIQATSVEKSVLDARMQSGSVCIAGNSDAEHCTGDKRDQKQEHPSPFIADPHTENAVSPCPRPRLNLAERDYL
jgi:hypothetical protein